MFTLQPNRTTLANAALQITAARLAGREAIKMSQHDSNLMDPNPTNEPPLAAPDPKCSFCDAPQREEEVLIQSQLRPVYICSECVAIAVKVARDEFERREAEREHVNEGA